jgi:hypothetical protein
VISLAQRAIALDPDSAPASRALALAHLLAGRFETAHSVALRSVELAPSNADNLQLLSWFQLRCGFPEDALRSIEACCEMHPLRPSWACASLAQALWAVGQPWSESATALRSRVSKACIAGGTPE